MIEGIKNKVFVPIGDFLLGRIMSKKLTVFFIAFFLLLAGYVTGTEWKEIAIVYMATQGGVDATAQIAKIFTKKELDEEQP